MTNATMQPGRVEVIATGLVEFNRRGMPVKDNRLRYDGMVYMHGQRLEVDRKHVRGLARRRQVQVLDELPAPDWYGAPGRVLLTEPGTATPRAMAPVDGSLRIAQGTGYDPGNAAYRFHTALNEHTDHASAFIRHINPRNNPYGCPYQYNASADPAMARALLLSADVVHTHIDHILTRNVGLPNRPRAGQVVVKHYHGTQFNGQGEQERDEDQRPVVSALQDDMEGLILVGARLTVCALRPGRIQWLPITVPVARYAAMVPAERAPGPFRIAHSPTATKIKGTAEFLRVCARLTKRGVPVEPVLIKRMGHGAALALKATCDATFDAFALGIQGSGLEAAAMGQPVIAGDAKVADLYRDHMGHVPYTFAGDEAGLYAAIERLVLDDKWKAEEAERVGRYVREVHDYPAVAARYSQLLADAGARRLD